MSGFEKQRLKCCVAVCVYMLFGEEEGERGEGVRLQVPPALAGRLWLTSGASSDLSKARRFVLPAIQRLSLHSGCAQAVCNGRQARPPEVWAKDRLNHLASAPPLGVRLHQQGTDFLLRCHLLSLESGCVCVQLPSCTR